MNSEILGLWELDPADLNANQIYGNVSLEFKNNGELIYTLFLEDKAQKSLLTYETRGNKIFTDQPSSPNPQETEFRILPDGKLELGFGGVKSNYVKKT